ncbi:Zinc carboxypeptidase [Cnuella takakiae]|uniref:Zinc carboxypeptidase n=1 Tax=Cnuella takakiae TaxID=1302690 RepID=A0A1M4WQQ3_9BACT|nr:M14 metallopeptidase family protein [Cnuella takakiae]OLY94713.1 zinc carboxypeptidase [Cnuella takakiae]SHE83403.1 Zinc carboxypeptidase [Cnuella takakiae]
MRKLLRTAALLLATTQVQAQDLSYYLPDSVPYNAAIPKPQEVIYHQVGEYHITHDRLVNYMQALAKAAPDRIKLEPIGFTYEGRPQVLLIITSPRNHQNLEQIRQQHVQLTDPSKSAALNTADMPAVVYIGHSIHGNEPSGANASLLSAYYLAAAKGPQIDDLLEHTVILFDPSFNPDGLQRFSTWVNQHRGKNLVTDPASREFNEVWPGGRFNHYWFDLNRDWLPAQHVESQNRLAWYHKWKPNILTDHHEQGSNATFFFQPGVPSRVNPITPAKNQELTGKIAQYHAQFLDRIGSLYFTKENYDDFYYGKGSTYPDVNGAVGILFEQASSRGHAQQTANGVLRFPFTIRNQFTTTLSTLEAARNLRRELLDWQREFYRSALTDAAANAVKGYVFGDSNDEGRTAIFVNMLRRHQIEVRRLANDTKVEGIVFGKNNSYVVPAAQPQHRLIKAIFDKTLEYKDSIFYDITSWTMPLAFGLPYAQLNAAQFTPSLMGEVVSGTVTTKGGVVGGKSEIGYLLDWKAFGAPAALYALQNAGIITKVATRPMEMTIGGTARKFDFGTILLPVSMQSVSGDQLLTRVQAIAQQYSVPVYAIGNGSVLSGSDLGSSKFVSLSKPSVAMVVGTGVSALDAGEIWHLFDQRFDIPMTHLDLPSFNQRDLSRYNTLIMVSGSGYSDINKDKLKAWVQNGGTLVLTEDAITWAAQAGICTVGLKRGQSGIDSAQALAYASREQLVGAQEVAGAIFRADVDLSHPLAYGYSTPSVHLFKANRVFMERSKSPFANPFTYGKQPLESGWVSRENKAAIANSAAVVVSTVGSGRVIAIADNPNLRAFWLGGTKLMMNAVFFGKVIEAGSARGEE